MKRVLSLLLSLMVFTVTVVSTAAASAGIADTGKTVMTIGDWVYEAIDGGKHWELDKYLGEDSDIVIPRITNNMMVVSIGSHCFNNNTTVKSVETSSPLWIVSEYAFLNSTSLESFNCSFALKEIGVGAFLGASSLSEINLEDSVVTVIKPHVFSNTGITQIQLPETCTEIMHDAFAHCPNLTKLVIPRSVTVIDENAFTLSDELTIYCYTDSYAHQYAAANDIPFVLLDAAPKYMLGDSNTDSVITILDATVIQRVLAGFPVDPFDEKAANITGEGLSIIDVTLIQFYLAKLPTSYPIGEWFTYDE